MANNFMVKHGASLQLLFEIQNDDGTPFDPTGTTVSSEVRDSIYKPIATLSLSATGAMGVFSVFQATDTWPTGPMLIDLKLVKAGVILKSMTFSVLVQSAVTA